MKIQEALNELLSHRCILRRKMWKNKRKAVFIAFNGALSVCYENKAGCMSVSRYLLYEKDLMVKDWYMIPTSNAKGTTKLDEIQKILQDKQQTRQPRR